VFTDIDEAFEHHSDYEYAYVFDQNLGKWFFCTSIDLKLRELTYRDPKLRELTAQIIEED